MNVLKLQDGYAVTYPYLCPTCGVPMLSLSATEPAEFDHADGCDRLFFSTDAVYIGPPPDFVARSRS